MRINKIKYGDSGIALTQGEINSELIERALYYLYLDDDENNRDLIKFKNAKKRTRHVFRFEMNKKVYYCKKYVNNNLFKIIQDTFRGQRAIRAFKLSVFLNSQGIHTVKPILAIVDNKRIFHRGSVIITEECIGTTIKNILLAERKEEDKQNIVEKIIQLYLKLVKSKIYHRDPNLSNFMLFNDKLMIIDLDDIRKLSMFSIGKVIRTLEKLNEKLLLCIIRNKGIFLFNEDREHIIKTLISKSVRKIDNIKIFEMVNLFVRYKMKRHFSTKDKIERHLKGGTVSDVDRNLSLNNLTTFNKFVKNLIL